MLNLKTRALQRREALSQLRLITAGQRRMASAIAKVLALSRSKIAEAVADNRDWKKVLAQSTPMLEQVILHHTMAIAQAMGQRARRAIMTAHEKKMDTEQELQARIKKWAKENAAAKVVDVTVATRKRITRIIQESAPNALGYREAAREIAKHGFDEVRALRIARTESHAAGMSGQYISVSDMSAELDLVFLKKWIATEDNRTRSAHSEMDGVMVGMEESFVVENPDTGDKDEIMHPGDSSGEPWNVINCRCAMTFEEPKKSKK
jgi:uncharacterized protein with gpF-like domain